MCVNVFKENHHGRKTPRAAAMDGEEGGEREGAAEESEET